MTDRRARIQENRMLGPGLYSLILEPADLREVKPGQFFEIRTGVRFLRRALSVSDRDGSLVRFIYRVVGPGTLWLSGLKKDDTLDVMGPLGQGVSLSVNDPVMLLGGGVGIAPLLYLARQLNEAGIKTDALLAASSKSELILEEEFKKYCREVLTATDDGSRGLEGRLTDVLPSLKIDEIRTFYACGPEPMLAALQRLSLNQPVYAFLESRMGCGTGLCVGCAVKSRTGGYCRVCTEGPVFNLKDIVL